MVVVYFRQAPIVTDADHLPTFPMQPNPQILDAVARLGAWADFIVITANGPHMIIDALAPHFDRDGASGRKSLDITRKTSPLSKRTEHSRWEPVPSTGKAIIIFRRAARQSKFR